MEELATTPTTRDSVIAYLTAKHGVTKTKAKAGIDEALKLEGWAEKFAMWEAMGFNADVIGNDVAVWKGWVVEDPLV
jgi:hypothetical protein